MKRDRAIVLGLAFASALAARAVAHFALSDVAHVQDEIAYLFQAKVFASLHLAAPPALPRAAFTTWFVEDRGARYSVFPPGWSALLAVGVRLGLTYWVNPILHGVTVVLVARAAERLAGPRLARIAAVLYAASPQALALAASLMSHTLVALSAAALLALWVNALRAEAPSPSRAVLATSGAALGVVAATRPLCAVILGLATLAALLVPAARTRTRDACIRAIRDGAIVGAAALPFVLLLLAWNRAMTGAALRFPQMEYFDTHLPPGNLPFFRYHPGCNDLGIGVGHGCDWAARDATNSIANAFDHTMDNLKSWLVLASSPLAVVGVGLALYRRSTRRYAAPLFAVPILTVSLYALYWHGGTAYGARFYHAALPALVLVTALGFDVPRRALERAALGVTLAWNVVAMAFVVHEIGNPSWPYWGVDDRFADLRSRWTHGPAIVMVAFGPDDMHNPTLGWTAVIPTGGMWMLDIRALAALQENEPDVARGEIVFAKFHPALVGELARRYPNRALWLYVANDRREGDSLAPYDPAPFARHANDPPADNFDGFRTAPPLLPPPDLLRAFDHDASYP